MPTPLEKTLAGMTKAQRDAPVTQGELVNVLARVARYVKELRHRNEALEQRIRQLESRL